MLEVAKLVGAMVWIIGLVFFFVFPPVGIFVLLIAIVISIFTATRTRERRHKDIVAAVGEASQPPALQT